MRIASLAGGCSRWQGDQGCRLGVTRTPAATVRIGGTPMDWRRLTVEYSAAAANLRGVFARLPRFSEAFRLFGEDLCHKTNPPKHNNVRWGTYAKRQALKGSSSSWHPIFCRTDTGSTSAGGFPKARMPAAWTRS